jgi:hypothetical protein
MNGHAETTQIIDARPEQIYAFIGLREGHPAILPKPYLPN